MEELLETTPTPPIPQKQPRWIAAFIIVAKIIGCGLAWAIMTSLFGFGMTLLSDSVSSEDLMVSDVSNWQATSWIYSGVLAGTFLVIYFFRVVLDRRPFSTVGFTSNKIVQRLVKGALYAIVLLSISFLLLWLLGGVKITDVAFQPLDLLGFLLLFFLAALVEELLFRGYMIPLIAWEFHFLVALIVSSLAFAALHIGNAHFTWISFANIFLGGYLMGLLFFKNQEIYTPFGLHWIWNYFQGNVLGFGVCGYQVASILRIEQTGSDWLTGGDFGLEGSMITVILLLGLSIYLTQLWYSELSAIGKGERQPVA
ncbi:MAG: type II CAAX endopeptidase family protein [Bacteroidota bacterium]